MTKKKPLLIFLVPIITPREDLIRELVNGSLGEFSGILAARLSTPKTIKQDVLGAIANGEMVVGVITEIIIDWDCNIPIIRHPGNMSDWVHWLSYSITKLVLQYGKNLLQGMQVR
jgi:hypothetical protein